MVDLEFMMEKRRALKGQGRCWQGMKRCKTMIDLECKMKKKTVKSQEEK